MVVRELLVRVGFSADTASMKRTEENLQSIVSTARGMVGIMATVGASIAAALGVHEITQIADDWAGVRARVGLVTDGIESQKNALHELRQISNETRQDYVRTGNLFAKLSRSSKDFGASQQDVLDVTKTINEALVIGGASTAEANSTILQLGQALASGRLQGDELRSLGENAPMLMAEIAKAYGVSIGQLKKLGAEGQLESKGVFMAILKAKSKMEKQFKEMPVTVGQAMQVARNYFGQFVEDVEEGTQVFKSMALGIVKAVKWIDNEVRYLAKRVGGFKNLMKIAAGATGIFSAAIIAINWGAIIRGFSMLRAAILGSAVATPMFWLIVAAVTAIALVIEDLYTWLTGGDSLLGPWLEQWGITADQVNGYLTMIKEEGIEAFSLLWSFVTWVFDSFCVYVRFWNQIFTGNFSGAIETVKSYFQGLLEMALTVLSDIGSAIGRYVLSKLSLAGEKLAELAGVKLDSVVSMQNVANVGRGGGVMNQQVDVNITVPNGTTAEQASYLGESAKVSYQDSWSKIGNNLAYTPGGGVL